MRAIVSLSVTLGSIAPPGEDVSPGPARHRMRRAWGRPQLVKVKYFQEPCVVEFTVSFEELSM